MSKCDAFSDGVSVKFIPSAKGAVTLVLSGQGSLYRAVKGTEMKIPANCGTERVGFSPQLETKR